MHAEHPVVQEKRPVLVLLHPRDGHLRHAILDVLIRLAGVRVEVLELPRRDITPRRCRPGEMRYIAIEAVLQRRIRFRPEMPFSKVPRRVTSGSQRLRQGLVSRVQPCRRTRSDRLRAWPRLLIHCRLEDDLRQLAIRRGDSDASRTESGEKARPRGRTKRTRCVGVCESHPAFGEAFEIRRFVVFRVSVERGVRPAEIVDEDEHDVRRRLDGSTARTGAQTAANEMISAWRIRTCLMEILSTSRSSGGFCAGECPHP